ncbi:hypothetical protein BGZ83_002556, partial [Gryganskiella cystojenkinii]
TSIYDAAVSKEEVKSVPLPDTPGSIVVDIVDQHTTTAATAANDDLWNGLLSGQSPCDHNTKPWGYGTSLRSAFSLGPGWHPFIYGATAATATTAPIVIVYKIRGLFRDTQPQQQHHHHHQHSLQQDGGTHYSNSTLPPLPISMNAGTNVNHPLCQQQQGSHPQQQQLHLGLYQPPQHPFDLSFHNLQTYHHEAEMAVVPSIPTSVAAAATTETSTTIAMDEDKECGATTRVYEENMACSDEGPSSWYGGNRDISYFQPSSPQSRFDEISAHHHHAVGMTANGGQNEMLNLASSMLDPAAMAPAVATAVVVHSSMENMGTSPPGSGKDKI